MLIRLLGAFQLVHGGQPVAVLIRPRLQALVGYLLLHQEAPIPRQRLAYLFWPDTAEQQAHTNLRNLLYKLRRVLPDTERYVRVTRHTIQWLADAPLWLDVAQFHNALNAAGRARQAGQVGGEEQALRQAVDAYGGQLLPDLYDDWVLAERERLAGLYAAALGRLAALLEGRREYATALEVAERLRQLDPLQEESYRLLMRLHALNEDRAAALRAYHGCVTVLAEELGAEPGEATQRAYRRLLKLPKEAEAPAQTPAGRLPLVGRQRQWQALMEAWQRARRGRAGLVLIAGEAGMGKTRLAEELVDRALRQGITAASARAYEAEGDLAYAPIADWLRSPALAGALEGLEEVWLREVARLVPQVLAGRLGLEPPGPLRERWQQQRFFEGLARAVLAGGEPVLLHLDDLQWCDGETLAWLGYLLRYGQRRKLLLVGSYRIEEIGSGHRLYGWLAAMREAGVAREVMVGPLDEVETVQLAGHVGGRALDVGEAAQLYGETEGHPLYVVERVRAEQGGDGLSPEAAAAGRTLPARVQGMLERRLAQLTAEGREVAGLAAVIGRGFSYEVLAAAGGGDEDRLLSGLEELWQRRIVREQGVDGYDFSHDRLREVAYEGLSPVRLRLLHRRVGEALERVHGDALDEVSGELAVHWERGGDLRRARGYLRRAGNYAAANYAHGEAITYLSRALDLTPEDALRERYDLLRQRERLHALMGTGDLRRADLDQMAQLADHLEEDGLRGQVALQRSRYYHQAGDLAAGSRCAQEALILGRAAGDLELQAASQLAYARITRNILLLSESRHQFEQALTLARQAGSTELEALAQSLIGVLLVYSGVAAEGRPHAQQALALARSLGDGDALVLALNVCAIVERGIGNPHAAREYLDESQRVAHQIGNRRLEALCIANLGGAHNLLGDLNGALAMFDQAAGMADETGYQLAHIAHMQYKAGTLYQLGRFQEGLALATGCVEFARADGDRREEAIALLLAGMLQGGQGQVVEASSTFQQALQLAQGLGDSLTELEALAGLARTRLAQEDPKGAVPLVEQILPYLLAGPYTHTETYAPFTLFMTCYRVLKKMGDPRAQACLQAGYREALTVADHMPDPALRRSFLENLGEVRELMAEMERHK